MSNSNIDLGIVTAYGYAKQKGYEGTEQEFAEMLANIVTYKNNAHESAIASESWANGGTDSREGEDTDNAHYWYQQAKSISESFSGALRPMGTVDFSNLPAIADATEGDMYNISDEFTTTDDFKEGSGITVSAGSNVYKTAEGKWDLLAGSPVTGVKGENETEFRRGNVNITKANIGLGNVDNTSDEDKPISKATRNALDDKLSLTGDSKDNAPTFTSGDVVSVFNEGNLGGQEDFAWIAVDKLATKEKHSTLLNKISNMFKNVRTIAKLIGTTDISKIGDGTITKGLSEINTSLLSKLSFRAIENNSYIIPSNSNLDNYTDLGSYICASGTVAATITNGPLNGNGYRLIVFEATSFLYLIQIAIANNTNSYPYIYFRQRIDGTWTVWRKIALS